MKYMSNEFPSSKAKRRSCCPNSVSVDAWSYLLWKSRSYFLQNNTSNYFINFTPTSKENEAEKDTLFHCIYQNNIERNVQILPRDINGESPKNRTYQICEKA